MTHPRLHDQSPLTADPQQRLTAKKVGALLSIGPKKVYQLPISKVRFSDKRVRYVRADVAEFIRNHRRGA